VSYVIISAIIIMSGHRSIYRIEVGMSHIVIDESKCKSCFICINTCPKGLIKNSVTNMLSLMTLIINVWDVLCVQPDALIWRL